MKAVLVYLYKPFITQLVIALLYISITCYRFVKSDPPDPIGTGLLQWVLLLLHLLTVVIYYFIRKSADSRQILLANLSGIVIPNGIYLLLSGPIWNWLWSIR